MPAPSSTAWGPEIPSTSTNNAGRIGIYATVSSNDSTSTVSVQVWCWSRYGVEDIYNTLYFNWNATSATTSVGNVSINHPISSGGGWSTQNQTMMYSTSTSYNRTNSNQTVNIAARLSTIEAIGREMSVTTSVTIPAVQTHTVTFNANGGTGAPAPQTKVYGYILILSSQVPTREGYKFVHWANNPVDNQATQWYDPGGQYGRDEDITLYAIWDGEEYTYTFDPNGGTGGPTTATKKRGVDFTFPSSQPSWEHHDFLGWRCDSVSGGPYQPGEQVHDLPDKNLTWLAQWIQEVVGTVVYDANGGEMAPEPQTKYYDVDLVLSTQIPVRYQYVFTGWGRTAGATIVEYSPGDTYRENASITLYAIWTPGISAIVHFDPNGGTGEPGDLNKLWNVDLQLSSVIPRKSLTITYDANGGTVSPTSTTINQDFLSWNTAQNGSGTSYAPGANYTTDESVTLYAQWGTATVTNLPTPTIGGSSIGFAGWFTSATGGTQISNGSTISDDTTIYAHWELIIHYVTEFQGVDIGIRIEDQYKTPNVDIIISDLIPEFDGYEFLGWSTTENATTAEYAPGSTYSKNEPATLYPVFVRDTTCTVTFDLRGGTSDGGGALVQEVPYGGDAVPPNDPTKEGTRFSGWLGVYTNVTSSRTIYAMWGGSPIWIFNGTSWESYSP